MHEIFGNGAPALVSFVSDLPELRRSWGTNRHLAIDIVTIAWCAVIGGADSFAENQEFGLTKQE